MTDRPLAERPPPGAKPAEQPKRGASSRFKSTAMRVQEFSLDDEPPSSVVRALEADEESAEEELPKDPAQAALVRFERTGDPVALAEARKIFSDTMQAAPHGTARA